MMYITDFARKCHGPSVVDLLVLLALAAPVVGWAADNGNQPVNEEDLISVGKLIYRDGLLPSGATLSGQLPGDIKLTGEQAACAKCHRRSGLGSSEGGKVVPSLIHRDLYEPVAARGIKLYGDQRPKALVRQAYTDESLSKALREGVDPTGRHFDAPMPTYALNDTDMAAITAYLKALSAKPDPGVTDKTIHLATIVTDGVSEERRKSMLDIMQAFIGDWDADIRQQAQRGKFALDAMYESYRQLELHVWDLKGPQGTWAAQLEKHYQDQPVFAVLGGIGTGNWRPVHGFCQHFEVPCLFPITDQPVVNEQDIYTLYFSKGPVTEAEALANHLKAQGIGAGSRVAQVFRSDETGTTAATALRKALEAQGFKNIRERGLRPSDKIPPAFWDGLMEEEGPAILVLWLEPSDLDSLKGMKINSKALRGVYLSGSLHQGRAPAIGDTFKDKLFLLYPYDLPDKRDQQLARMKGWLQMKKIPLTDDLVQSNAYFAVVSVSEAIKHMRNNYFRDYLMERLENMSNSPIPSAYPHLSLGPGQRYASKGCYVVKPTEKGELKPVSGLIVP